MTVSSGFLMFQRRKAHSQCQHTNCPFIWLSIACHHVQLACCLVALCMNEQSTAMLNLNYSSIHWMTQFGKQMGLTEQQLFSPQQDSKLFLHRLCLLPPNCQSKGDWDYPIIMHTGSCTSTSSLMDFNGHKCYGHTRRTSDMRSVSDSEQACLGFELNWF